MFFLCNEIAFSQGPYGDVTFRRMGVHDGNLIATIFFNQGDISGWGGWGYPPPRVEWPKGSGHEYSDENSIFVIAEVMDTLGNILHILSESSLDWDATDINAENGQQMGWEPLPGYLNPAQGSPAMSHLPESWPDFWPDKQDLDDPGWPGSWNGFFGRDVFQADQESYFVMDDNFNTEFGQFVPDPADPSRKGLGLKISARGLQWADPLAQDAMFWLYDITNVSATTYDKIVFGEVFDARMGGPGEENDDLVDFDTALDIVFSWDLDDIGSGGWSPVGYFGFAFLESPGIANDGLDNDEDGLIDESRDSGPGEWIFGPIGIYGEPKDHWSGDEDGDWIGYTDLNGNGQWETGEPLNDDLGMDGIGPDNPFYPGEDTGEGDGIPTSGEPNFDQTDVDESDQIGLTSMDSHIENSLKFSNDELMWPLLLPGHFNLPVLSAVNLEFFYGSGFFLLEPGKTERFSLAMVLGEDKDDILRNKQVVQSIYNANYNFGVVTDIRDEAHAGLPVEYSLSQNYPNPFNPETVIEFALQSQLKVSLIVYNLRGEKVAQLINRNMPAGMHRVNWDASNVSSGIYFYRLQAGDFVQTRKMVLLK
ncbi:MAG: T9SS type A sorting domain-containing protein [Candidatus Marinimicrobia bacterium]|nr:T9SS type A sorting domain-containing protein [Candidatus Neomarinimicrobiota bacterium]